MTDIDSAFVKQDILRSEADVKRRGRTNNLR